ncbi:MAG: hypothetical protein ABWZ66_13765 [Pyrinomonadaceae bacterium]
MPERKRTPRTKRLIVNDEQKFEILPTEDKEPKSAQENLANVIAQLGDVVISAVVEDAAGKTERAKIELPLKQEQLKLQDKQIANYHEVQLKAQTAFFGKQTREFWFNSLVAFLILIFMMTIGGFLLYTGDNTNGMAIIGLLIGLIGGFLGGAGWQKTRNQPDEKQTQS